MWGFASAHGGIANSVAEGMKSILVWNFVGTLSQLPASLYRQFRRAKAWLFPEISITIPEQGREWYIYNKVFSAAETYLGTIASDRANLLKAGTDRFGRNILLTMDNSEVISDAFVSAEQKVVPVKWGFYVKTVEKGSNSQDNEKRYYRLRVAAKFRKELIEYLRFVMDSSREIESRNRQRKLYTNSIDGKDRNWTSVPFKHPAKFETLAMDPKKKKEIMDDLETFSKSRDYYAKIGKAWKRGYLLYGPPGTGKSTMIACMANFLDYDIYDLELTAVKDNTELRRLIINTTSKSIIVIEDIDCSLGVTLARRDDKEEKKSNQDDKNEEEEEEKKKKKKGESKVTLAGLLNFIDGLWTACGEERLVVFTTNHVEKLDPALIRPGRMDKKVEISYCCFEAFRVFAKNYLDIDEHPQFEKVRRLLAEVEMTPADVAEQLMPKDMRAEDKAARCLENLVVALEKLKVKKETEKKVAAEKNDMILV